VPKINKQGPSYSDGDPRHRPVAVPEQRDSEQVADDEMNDSSVNEGAEQEAPMRSTAATNYDDTSAWSYPDLQEECRRRQLAGALNVSRDELVARLRESDANTSPSGD
jgi:hypothetical protein